MPIDPYATLADVQNVIPYIGDLDDEAGDGFLTERRAARRWFDAAVRVATGSVETITIVVDDDVIRANAYKAAAEILLKQITPSADPNVYQHEAVRKDRIAESIISTLRVWTPDGSVIRLGIARRG